MLSSRMSLTRCPRARTPRLPARGASVLRESLCPLPLCVIFSRPSTPPRRSPVRRPPPSRSAPAIRRDRRTASCNSQLQLATFPRSVDYAGLKSNLSPFRINTSKNSCIFYISLISGQLKSSIINTSMKNDFKFFIITTSEKTGGWGSSCNSSCNWRQPSPPRRAGPEPACRQAGAGRRLQAASSPWRARRGESAVAEIPLSRRSRYSIVLAPLRPEPCRPMMCAGENTL